MNQKNYLLKIYIDTIIQNSLIETEKISESIKILSDDKNTEFEILSKINEIYFEKISKLKLIKEKLK
jgi:hypothetical protein